MHCLQLCYIWKQNHLNQVGSAVTYLGFIPTNHFTLLGTPAPDSRFIPKHFKEIKEGSPIKHNEPDMCSRRANTNQSKAFSMIVLVTVQRQCCVCSGGWRRWATWVSGLCSPAMAAWLPGGRVRPGETTLVALCIPPASRGPLPSPQPHRLWWGGPDTRRIKNTCTKAW